MAGTGQFLTLADLASRADTDGTQSYIAEMMSQSVVVMDDMPLKEASEIMGHSFVFRDSIPAGAWRALNSGVGYSKSTTGKSTVGLGSLEGWSQIDRLLAEQSGNVAEFRKNEDVAFLEGMGQTMEQTLWYGNSAVTPAQFNGFATFYNTIANAQNGANVINGGGAASANASLWLIAWSERGIFGLTPRGSPAGLTSDDRADTVPAYDSLGNPFVAYTMWFRHIMGLCPQDWRQAVRIANLDTTTAGLAGATPPDLFQLMSKAVMLPPALGKMIAGISKTDAPNDPSPSVRPVWYANRTVRYYMDVQGMRDRNVLLTINDAAGKPQDVFRGIPVKVSDQLLNTETTVT